MTADLAEDRLLDFDELATISELDYQRCKKPQARLHQLSVAGLDAVVKARRAELKAEAKARGKDAERSADPTAPPCLAEVAVTVARLAAMSPCKSDQIMRREAERLRITVATLRNEVVKQRRAGAITARRDSPTAARDEATEDAIARKFAEEFEGQAVYDHTAKRWYRWIGARWQEDEVEIDIRRRPPVRRGEARERTRRSRYARARQPAVYGAVAADPKLSRHAAIWDTHPMLLGVPTGYVDLQTGEMHPGDPTLYLSKETTVAPAPPGTPHPIWSKFLEEALGSDKHLEAFLQRLFGYILTGLISEEIFIFFYGEGGQGKGTVIRVFVEIMKDYAIQMSAEMLDNGNRQNPDYERAAMQGKRLVTSSETKAGSTLSEAFIKELTGNEGPVSARNPFGRKFNFDPQFKVLSVGNHAPKLHGGPSKAFGRRLRMFPFDHPPKVVDPSLKEALKEEYPAILRWGIEGCVAMQRDGLGSAAAIDAQNEAYLDKQNTFGHWLEERCAIGPNGTMTPSALYADHLAWASANHEAALDNITFSEQLDRTPGVTRRKNNGLREMRGISLKPSGAKHRTEAEESAHVYSDPDEPPF